MKPKVDQFSRRYQAALQEHLQRRARSSRAGLSSAKTLGSQALTLGLATLDLARIHEQTLIALVLPERAPGTRDALVRHAGTFFAEAIRPIETTHRLARESNLRAARLNQTLRRRGVDLAASNQELKEEIARRKSLEESLRKSEEHYARLLEQLQRMQEQLRLLSRQLLLAQEEERKKISRELHDVIAQTLTSINVQLANLKNKAGLNTKGIERSIAHTQRLVERSVNIVHRFARELRPTVLDDLGLIPASRTFMKGFIEETGIRVSLAAFAAVEEIHGDRRTVLFRVAQEALNNVARHAQATRAEVKIQKLDDSVCMTIEDNGKGFQEKRVLHARQGKRLGLLGMRERLEMVGGSFAITSTPGGGTTVTAKVPTVNKAPMKARRRSAHPASS